MQLPKCVLFDLDGVLVDATEIHYEALNKALNLFGFNINREDHLKIFNGLPTQKKLEILTEKYQLPESLHTVISAQKKIYTEHLIQLNCKAAYDKILMLDYLFTKGVKLGVCSNAIYESVKKMLNLTELTGYFNLIMGNDSVAYMKPKPNPDIYIHAMDILKVEPKDTWIVEDAPHGIEAAKEANVGKVIEVAGYHEVNLNLFT